MEFNDLEPQKSKTRSAKKKQGISPKPEFHTDLDGELILAGFESTGEELGERIGLSTLDARDPGLRALVAKEHVAFVGVDGAGQVALVHLLSPEAELLIFVGHDRNVDGIRGSSGHGDGGSSQTHGRGRV